MTTFLALVQSAPTGTSTAGPLLQFLESHWLNVIFGLASVFGLLVGFLSWRSARRQSKVYEFLFQKAAESLETLDTAETLRQKKQELKDASARIRSLQEKIRADIPREARRALLLDRYRTQKDLLARRYGSFQSLQAELDTLGEANELPREIRRTIELEIQPEYLLQERRAGLKTTLSIITAGAAVASAVLPYPVSRWLSVALLLVAVPVLGWIVFLALRHGGERFRRLAFVASFVLAVASGLVAAAVAGMLFFVAFQNLFALSFALPLVAVFGLCCWYVVRNRLRFLKALKARKTASAHGAPE